MQESLTNWWSKAEVQEKQALIVLASISAGIFLIVAGISVSKALAIFI